MIGVAGGILALDLSSHCGWAYGPELARDPLFGTWHLPYPGGEGARYAAFENELAAAIVRLQPGSVVLEASLSFQALLGVSTMAVMRQQLTLRGFAYSEAWRASIPISEVSADIVRLALLGQSRFAKGKVKGEVIRYCRAQGWKVPDDNAADACLTWAWTVNQRRGIRPASGPLFQSHLLQ